MIKDDNKLIIMNVSRRQYLIESVGDRVFDVSGRNSVK